MAGESTRRPPGRWPVELVEMDAADGRRLEGLLHQPSGVARANLLLLHGKGGNCYSGVARFLPPVLAGHRVRTLSLNMRCHDLGYTRQDIPFVDNDNGSAAVDGGMWERGAVAELDVAAGLRQLRALGPEPVVLAGHASGAFHAVRYAARDHELAARVLLSPTPGGRRPLSSWFGSAGALAAAEALARRQVAARRGHLLIPLRAWYYAISARSLVERIEERPGVWEAALHANRSPVLMLWGSAETGNPDRQRVYAGISAPKKRVVLPGVELNYVGREYEVSSAVVDFVRGVVR